MRLLALSDLHVGYAHNRDAIAAMPASPDDWLILGGDVGETFAHLEWTLDTLGPRFARLLWVPGNHELWCEPRDGSGVAGVERYARMVGVCRERGVLTPEDPFPLWPGAGPPTRICPLFVGYDYSFGPDGLSAAEVVKWAAEEGIRCTDEFWLKPDPYPSREAWCGARVTYSEARLDDAARAGERLVLINHWPLRRDLVRLYRIPRFIPWCGTRKTEDWHLRWPVDVVVSGHLHMRSTDWRGGVRFEETALGYPAHWRHDKGAEGYLRTILPRPGLRIAGDAGPEWHR